MGKEILRFRGLTLNRDEQSAEHGELALCAGVELHDGALRASVLEGSMVENPLVIGGGETEGETAGETAGTEGETAGTEGEPGGEPADDSTGVAAAGTVATLRYVHETAGYRHFIGEVVTEASGSSTVGLYWFGADGTAGDEGTAIHEFTDDEVISVSSVGNTLVVLAASGVHYVLWKGDGYKYLGTQFPFVDIRFRPTERKTANFDLSTITDKVVPDKYNQHTAWRQIPSDPSNLFSVATNTVVNIKSDQRTDVTESVWALINQSNNTIAKDGHFYAPFLIRYCYRLYDGSMVMHSAPVFMNVSVPKSYRVYLANCMKPSSKTTQPAVGDPTTEYYDREDVGMMMSDGNVVINTEGGENITIGGTGLFYIPNNVGIEYSVLRNSDNLASLDALKDDWTDIVKSIDIFVSPMMTREKQGEQIKTLTVEEGDICGINGHKLIYNTSVWQFSQETTPSQFVTETTMYQGNVMFDIPLLSEDEYVKKVRDCSNFFLLKSFNLGTDKIEIPPFAAPLTFFELDYNKDIVPNITSQEQMKDDYHTHTTMVLMENNRGMYVYNHRVNLYGMKEKMFEGFSMRTMVNYATYMDYWGFRYGSNGFLPCDMGMHTVEKIAVELNVGGERKWVVKTSAVNGLYDDICAFSLYNALPFYPDSRATKMVVYLELENSGEHVALVLGLDRSNFLNGAVYSSKFYKPETSWTEISNQFIDINDADYPVYDDSEEEHDIEPMPNKIFTSEVDNPYYFPVEGRNTVGTGIIRGVAAVTRALSQGQVGDHDLVVFATDGIWVMKVSAEGTYSGMHNISREVCTNPRSICQLDQSIVFATERGLSRFVESNVVSMSEALDGPVPDWSRMLPGLVAAMPGADASGVVARMLAFGTPAVEMFNEGRVFYDYASARVIVMPDGEAAGEPGGETPGTVAMVFSLRDEAWSTMLLPAIRAVVPGYPSPFVQLGGGDDDGKVMVLDKAYGYSASGDAKPGLIITRTLTFSGLMDVIRGFRQYTDAAVMPTLYFFGSNDQRNWKEIGHTSRESYDYMPGKTFRFFRVAVYMEMKPSEEYQQLMVETVNKYVKI